MNRFMNHYKALNINYESGVAYSLIHCTDPITIKPKRRTVPAHYRYLQAVRPLHPLSHEYSTRQ